MNPRKRPLKSFLAEADAWRSPDHLIGSTERYGGIRNRTSLWRRADRLAQQQGDLSAQGLIDRAVQRCRRLHALRAYRAQRHA